MPAPFVKECSSWANPPGCRCNHPVHIPGSSHTAKILPVWLPDSTRSAVEETGSIVTG